MRTLSAVLLLVLAGPTAAGVVAGKIVDEAGNPVGGVEVSVHDPTEDRWVVGESYKNGRFSLAGHWEKPVALLARKEGYLTVEMDGVGPMVRDLVVVLRKPGRLTGKVTRADGMPPGERIFVNLMPLHPELAAGILRVESDTDGKFLFDGLRPGWYDLLAAPRKGPCGIERAIRVPSTGPIEVWLPSKRHLMVTLRDAEGAPVKHTRLTLRYLSERWQLGRPPVDLLTNPEGMAAMEDLPVIGGAVFTAYVEGRAPVMRRIDLIREGEIELRLPAGHTLEGRGPGGASEGDTVRYELGPGLPVTSATRERGAMFVLEGLGPGLGLLLAELDGATHFGRALIRAGRSTRYELGSVPGKPLEVTATLDGQPAEGRWIALSKKRPDRGATGGFMSGVAKATGMAIDPCLFFFEGGEVQAITDVRPGRRRAVSLTSRTAKGRLLADGKTARGALVLTVPMGILDAPRAFRPAAEPTRTDATGRFETPRIAGGPWGLLALDEAHGPYFQFLGNKDEDVGDLVLPPGALLRVHVKDGEGSPVIDAAVHARDRGGRRITVRPRLTDADGMALLLLAPGTWKITARTPDLGTATVTVKLGLEGAETTIVPMLR